MYNRAINRIKISTANAIYLGYPDLPLIPIRIVSPTMKMKKDGIAIKMIVAKPSTSYFSGVHPEPKRIMNKKAIQNQIKDVPNLPFQENILFFIYNNFFLRKSNQIVSVCQFSENITNDFNP